MRVISALLLLTATAGATIFGSVRGVVHDPQHRPLQGAMVMVKARSSEWTRTTTTNSNGEFEFQSVPLGEYVVSVASPGFIQTAQDVVVISGTQPVVHFQMKVLAKSETVNVSATPEIVPTDTATPTTL